MSEEEFINESLEVLRILQNNPKRFPEDNGRLRRIKDYILNNENSQTVKLFIDALLRLYRDAFINKGLVDAFNIPNTLHYRRQIEIFKNLPHWKYPIYGSYLGSILEMPSDIFWNIYLAYPWALKKYDPELASNQKYMKFIQDITDFERDNHHLTRGGVSDYHELNEEIELYNNSCRIGDDNTRFKSIGNIGELHIFSYLEFIKFNPRLVAREVKDGFGYDIYLIDKDNNEILIEVKTTMYERPEDSFEISKNEYDVLKSTLNNPHAEYFIFRLKLSDPKHGTFKALKALDEQTLADYKDPNHQYRLLKGYDNKLYFMEGPQSPQVLKK